MIGETTILQEGLKAQQSRMDVDLPFAARLGVETSDGDDKGKKVHSRCDDTARGMAVCRYVRTTAGKRKADQLLPRGGGASRRLCRGRKLETHCCACQSAKLGGGGGRRGNSSGNKWRSCRLEAKKNRRK